MKILVAEDDAAILKTVRAALEEGGFATLGVSDGKEAEFMGQTETFDAVVLDLGLPGLDGISILEAWRKAGRTMPVLILTAREEWSEKVRGFRAGADDYVTKPFRPEEVVIRVRSLVRRANGHATSILQCGPLALDTQMGAIARDGLPLKLTAFEFRLLGYMMHHPERVLTRTELSEHLYADDADRDYNSIEVVIGRLRKKVGAGQIETVRGQGYRLTAEPSS
ncbi:response regulator transcription factor [Pelagibacterium luteolum]|uniref:Two-component system, OmpR family, response regulator n=1 Tax=Pelagibacterium luteolum TaxID=440168 RepID=A0A1G7RQ75_9HYPH|nr:response regulator transcription factor [Pelagibacterium luteolum]SDG12835.1 two-component system, OmpR family, response regulator [Pelagibacterium luteolum]